MLDAHVYSLPARLRDPAVDLPPGDEAVVRAIHRHPEGPYALSLSAPEAIRESMDRCGIRRSVLVSFPWDSPGLCRENNDHVLGQAAADPRFLAVCSARPGLPGWEEEVRRTLAAGAAGIKINPVWQHLELDGPEVLELAALAEEAGTFLMVHVDHAYRRSPASPARLFALAERRPGLRILAAHLGGLLGLHALHPPVARTLANVWFDTAVSSTLEMVGFCHRAGLAERLVFGSDFPFNHCHDQITVLEGLRRLGLPPVDLEALLEGNFLRLAKLDPEERP